MAANRPRSPEYVTYARIAKNHSGTTCLDFRSPAPQSHAPNAVPTVVRMLGDIYPDLSAIKSEVAEGQTQSGSGTSVAAATTTAQRQSALRQRRGTPQPLSATGRYPSRASTPAASHIAFASPPCTPPSLSRTSSITGSAVQSQTDSPRVSSPPVPDRHSQSIRSPAVYSASVRTTIPVVVPVTALSPAPLPVSGDPSPASREGHGVHDAGVRSTVETSGPSVLKLDDVDPQTYKREVKLCQLTEDEKAAMRGRKGKAAQVERMFTAWFESTAALPLASPPDLSAHDEIQLGDLYWHESPVGVQLWLWIENEDDMLVWKPVRLGFSREIDGRRLFLNPSGKPSWMTNNWYHKQKAAPRNVFVMKNKNEE